MPLSDPENPDWWRGGVIYQIYPRSFQDSNGDGIGDLQGIVQRLDHVVRLGVDAIWISPFYRSPMKDFGYDVSDFCDVDPIFGTLADFDALVAAAHAAGLRVIIDLVLSHTSDQHPWFSDSRAARDGAKSDWYVWADPRPDGTAPNNWLSIFGGSAWQWDTRREQYYLHNFLASQPDLNLHNEDVQAALLETVRFWLDRGVDGFRLDTVNFYFHDAELRDNPALPEDRRSAVLAPAVNPYNYQDHVYSKNRPETLAFIAKLRALMDGYGAVAALGEIGDALNGLALLGEYTRGEDRLHMCYAFEFLAAAPLTAVRVADVLREVTEVATEGWPAWAFSNHDVTRHATRWDLSPAAQRLFASLLVCLPGAVCLYQGEELGLTEDEIPREHLQDPYGIEFWPEFTGRDGCRTPMVWAREAVAAGFSDSQPWLPQGLENTGRAVDVQEADPGAILHHYRRAIALRRAWPALQRGRAEAITVAGDVLSFQRVLPDQVLWCAFNMSDTPSPHDLPCGAWEIVGAEIGSTGPLHDNRLHLGPWQVCLARRLDG